MPDGTTTLVYDNLFFFLAHGVDGLRRIVDADERRARARVLGGAARAADGVRGRGERFPTDVVAPLLSWPEVVASGEITNWSAAARGEFAAGIAAAKAARRRVEGHNAGASYDRLAELSAAGISSDHEAITGAGGAATACGSGMWTMLRNSSLRPDLERMLRGPRAGDRLAAAG